MRRNLGCKIRVGAAVLVMGAATIIGISAAPTVAGAAPVNLIQNGNFVPTTATTVYTTVSVGDSSTIPGWTVDGLTGGSVDVVSDDYWTNVNNAAYSIDLAGSTGVPGGLYQDVATTPGVEYQLSFWSAVNGDEAAGHSHTTDVSVNGSIVDTVATVGTGNKSSLGWVQSTVNFTASSTTSKIEFDDATTGDTDYGPTLDDVSLVAGPSGTPVTIPPQVAGTTFNATVATFTDSDTTLADFSATVNWGNGTTAGAIGGSDGSFTVTGTNDYASIGTYGPVVVTITDSLGLTATVTDNSVQVASGVTLCSGSCTTNAPATTQNPVNAQVSTTGSGYVLLSTFPNTGKMAFSCGDGFKHAPSDVVETNTLTSQSATVKATDIFPAKDGTQGSGLEGLFFWVCFNSNVPFKDLTGQSVTTGLLPLCNPFKPGSGPCVDYILPTSGGNITEQITYPAGDPGYR
jgi:hypothetical protein